MKSEKSWIKGKLQVDVFALFAFYASDHGMRAAREFVSAPPLNPKVVEVYTKCVFLSHIVPLPAPERRVTLYRIGQLLSRYKSGPLPKAFKILPSLRNWRQLLELTAPHTWTAHATYAATRIFSSNLDPKQSQRFYRDVVYERVRDEIAETKKLKVQTYAALKKALFKPAAFFKGILFPLCQVRRMSLSSYRACDVSYDLYAERHLHSEGSCHRRFGPHQSQHSGPAFGRRFTQAR